MNYIASTKVRDPHTFSKTRGAIVSRGHKYFAHTRTHTYTHTHTHTHTHTKKNIEKLVVSFNLPVLTIPSAPGAPARSSGLFPRGLLGTYGKKIKKNTVFRVLVIWVNHLIANCVCGTIIL